MHSGLLLVAFAIATVWRLRWQAEPNGDWQSRWQAAFSSFCLPPLLVLSTAAAVLWMGHHPGQMLGIPVSIRSCQLAQGLVALALLGLGYEALKTPMAQGRLRQHPRVQLLPGVTARCHPGTIPFAGLVGVWRPELMVTQGLLDTLTPQQLEAIWHHERAHLQCRDPQWNLGLGWLKRLSIWLPYTQPLWEELLLLQEIRADHQAAQVVDPLVLAELLVALVTSQQPEPQQPCLGFAQAQGPSRLQQRIRALVEPLPQGAMPAAPPLPMMGALLILSPLLLVVCHH